MAWRVGRPQLLAGCSHSTNCECIYFHISITSLQNSVVCWHGNIDNVDCKDYIDCHGWRCQMSLGSVEELFAIHNGIHNRFDSNDFVCPSLVLPSWFDSSSRQSYYWTNVDLGSTVHKKYIQLSYVQICTQRVPKRVDPKSRQRLNLDSNLEGHNQKTTMSWGGYH